MVSIDILMPYYGSVDYLLRAIASVRSLHDADWRLTIVEDCYPDGPAVRQQVLDLADERIRYLRNEDNLGVAGNTFRALELAERDYFVLMDSDDLMLPNYSAMVSELFGRHPDALIAQPAVQVVDEDDRVYQPLADKIKTLIAPKTETMLRGEAAATSLLRGNWLYSSALCYRNTPVTTNLRLRPGTDHVHDLGRLIDVVLAGGGVAIGTEPGFQYRRHRASHSGDGNSSRRFEQERAYFDLIGTELDARGWNSAARAARHRLFSRLNAATRLPTALRSKDRPLTKDLLNHALR